MKTFETDNNLIISEQSEKGYIKISSTDKYNSIVLLKKDILKLAEMIKAEEPKREKKKYICNECYETCPCVMESETIPRIKDCMDFLYKCDWKEVKEPETKSENIKVLNIPESKKQKRLSKFVGKQAVKLRELENKLSIEMDETNEMLIMILENKRKINEKLIMINDNRDEINHILERLRDLEKEVKRLGFHVPDFGKSNKELAERIKDISERLRILEQKKKDKIPAEEGYYQFADRVVYVLKQQTTSCNLQILIQIILER